jgi:flavin-dependent dehydrogenase
MALLTAALDRDPVLGPRFRRARPVTPPVVLGPLAVDARAVAAPGLFLVGDAAGFVDPMTGDGIHLAWQGAELAVDAVRRLLEEGQPASEAGDAYGRALAGRLALKRAFDRSLRLLVGVPAAVTAAAHMARVWPGAFRTLIRVAGDAVPARS